MINSSTVDEQTQSLFFTYLPFEMQVYILGCLKQPKDIRTCFCVCKKLQSIAQSLFAERLLLTFTKDFAVLEKKFFCALTQIELLVFIHPEFLPDSTQRIATVQATSKEIVLFTKRCSFYWKI